MRDALTAGAAAAAAYATVEMVCAVFWRWAFEHNYAPPSPVFIVVASTIYLLLGASIGAVVGVTSLGRRARWRAELPWLVVALAGVATATSLPRGSQLAIVAAIALVAAGAVARLRWMANAWSASLLLITPLWVVKDVLDINGSMWNPLVAGGIALATIIPGYVLSRLRIALPATTPFATLAVTTVIALMLPGPKVHAAAAATAPAERAPNIILVVFDTVRADHLSLYGYARSTSPQLAEFASQATIYQRAYSPANATLPTHATWFTGLWPSEHGAHFDPQAKRWQRLPDSAETLAELLTTRGYRTALVAANDVFLGANFGLDQGFQYVDARPPRASFGAPRAHYFRARLVDWAQHVGWLPQSEWRRARSGQEINAAVVPLLHHLQSDTRPFFLVVNYMDAHSPRVPPEPYASMFEGGKKTRLPIDLFEQLVPGYGPTRVATVEEREHLVAEYDGALRYLDSEFRVFLDELRRCRLFDDALLIVTSDHGEAFGAHGLIGHDSSTYDDQIRVPLVVKRPGQTNGAVVSSPTSTVAIHQFIREAAGLLPVANPQSIVAEAFPTRHRLPDSAPRRAGHAVVIDRYKMIENLDGTSELYDLVDDPDESTDLSSASDKRSLAAQMRSDLLRWQSDRRALPDARPLRTSGDLDRRLRSLGYVR